MNGMKRKKPLIDMPCKNVESPPISILCDVQPSDITVLGSLWNWIIGILIWAHLSRSLMCVIKNEPCHSLLFHPLAQEVVNNYWLWDHFAAVQINYSQKPPSWNLGSRWFYWDGKGRTLSCICLLHQLQPWCKILILQHPIHSVLRLIQVQSYPVDFGLPRRCIRNMRLFSGMFALCSKRGKMGWDQRRAPK